MAEIMDRPFVKLDPPLRATFRPKGHPSERAEEAAVTGIHAEGLLVDPLGREAPVLGLPVEIALEVAAGEIRGEALVDAEAPPSGVVLRFTHLAPADRARLESFITRNRKSDHIRIVNAQDVSAEGITSGFERYRLVHDALPELDLAKVDLGVRLLGKDVRAPLLISCMTGGSDLAKTVNRRLAAAAQRLGLPLGVGSMRALLGAKDELLDTYAVRDIAPDVLLVGNIGAVQLNYGVTIDDLVRLVEMVGADALALHLNPLQEAVQPEGDTRFEGLRRKIADAAAALPVPVILKEVGSGISREVARWVRGTKIAAVDTAGAGGTNWAKVESHRTAAPLHRELGRAFAGWGIPTADSLAACREELPDRAVIASGGIRDGIEAAKALALGADAAGIARPFLQAAMESEAAVIEAARLCVEELRVAMFCCGAGRPADLRRAGTIEKIHWGEGPGAPAPGEGRGPSPRGVRSGGPGGTRGVSPLDSSPPPDRGGREAPLHEGQSL